jgi:hypothetical protein
MVLQRRITIPPGWLLREIPQLRVRAVYRGVRDFPQATTLGQIELIYKKNLLVFFNSQKKLFAVYTL